MFKQQRSRLISLVLVLIFASYLRLNGVLENAGFWDDTYRDILTTQNIHKHLTRFEFNKLPTAGPQVEPPIGINAHHGAFYFYFITPVAIFSNFHPLGLSLFVIILNIVAVYLIYLLGKELIDDLGGVIAALLFAVSNLAVTYSKFPWNPNLISFFVLMSLLSTFKIERGNLKFWPLFSFALAATTQIHLLGYLFAFTFIPILFKKTLYPRGKILIYSIICFFIPILPEIIYQISDFSLIGATLTYIQKYLLNNNILIFIFIVILFGIALSTIYVKRFRFVLLISWSVSTSLILIFATPHLRRGIEHPLLFVLPLFLIFLSALIRKLFTLRELMPFGVMLNVNPLYTWRVD